ncbi:hypothetical protein GQ44DRAFT_757182 [Phaeosphaeriaceae sp. PMI808]|nr:hypothetical protein GQ44DRAFT_757182 [Phaeosphaeriaceae sp. PMI808]
MPTEEENVLFLYLVLTHSGAPNIDWDAVGTAMDLNKGAVTKRWTRLRNAMENHQQPSGSVYKFLWLCVKHSTRDKGLDWVDIAKKCGTTSGAASKRYSRMKQAFNAGVDAPGGSSASTTPKTPKKTPSKKKVVDADNGGTPTATPKKTPSKKKVADADDDGTPTATPKRKRATPKATKIKVDHGDEASDEDDGMADKEESPTKKVKPTKPKGEDTQVIKKEELGLSTPPADADSMDSKVEDKFIDANEWVNDLVANHDDGEETLHREELETVVGVVDLTG